MSIGSFSQYCFNKPELLTNKLPKNVNFSIFRKVLPRSIKGGKFRISHKIKDFQAQNQ